MMFAEVERRETPGGAVSWRVRIILGKRDGGPRVIRGGTYRLQRDAFSARDHLLDELRRGSYSSPSTMPVTELVSRYLTEALPGRVGQRTVERYEGILQLSIAPHFEAMTVDLVRSADVQAWQADRLRRGKLERLPKKATRKPRHVGPLAPSTVCQERALLSGAYEWGRKMGHVHGGNPVRDVDPPETSVPEQPLPTLAQVGRLLEATRGTQMYVPTVIAATTGLRIGEVLGLCWCDVGEHELQIRGSLSDAKAGLVFKTTKNGKAHRVAVSPLAAAAIREERRRQMNLRQRAGLPRIDDSRLSVCPRSSDGGPIRPGTFSSEFAKMASRQGIACHVHQLRAVYATQMLALTDVRTVQGMLNHGDVRVTMRYARQVPERVAAAVDAFSEAISRLEADSSPQNPPTGASVSDLGKLRRRKRAAN